MWPNLGKISTGRRCGRRTAFLQIPGGLWREMRRKGGDRISREPAGAVPGENGFHLPMQFPAHGAEGEIADLLAGGVGRKTAKGQSWELAGGAWWVGIALWRGVPGDRRMGLAAGARRCNVVGDEGGAGLDLLVGDMPSGHGEGDDEGKRGEDEACHGVLLRLVRRAGAVFRLERGPGGLGEIAVEDGCGSILRRVSLAGRRTSWVYGLRSQATLARNF